MRRRTLLSVEVEYDADLTDPDELVTAIEARLPNLEPELHAACGAVRFEEVGVLAWEVGPPSA